MTIKNMPVASEQASVALLLAIRKILRPLVRLLLRFRISFPQATEMLRSLYVEIAEAEFPISGKPQTDARLTLLTGIHRKDIKRLRQLEAEERETPQVINLGGRLVNRWISEPAYLDSTGKPAPLPLKSTDGRSFEALVADVFKKDMRARVILDEWLSLGVVTVDTNNCVYLKAQAFIPSQGLDEKAFFLGHNLSDHLAAAAHNISQHEPPFFERCVFYGGLSPASIEQLRALVEEKGMEALMAINEQAKQLQAMDTEQQTGECRINVGLYVYHEHENKAHE